MSAFVAPHNTTLLLYEVRKSETFLSEDTSMEAQICRNHRCLRHVAQRIPMDIGAFTYVICSMPMSGRDTEEQCLQIPLSTM